MSQAHYISGYTGAPEETQEEPWSVATGTELQGNLTQQSNINRPIALGVPTLFPAGHQGI